MEFENRKYYVKDKEIVCPECGTKNSINDLVRNGEFDMMSFEENSCPEDFNPFDKKSSDRIALSYNCHCKSCEEYIQVNLVTSIFAYDIYDRDCNIIDTVYTENIDG